MSVKTKLTAIADKIRTMLGITGTMGLDAMAANLDTAQNAVDYQSELISNISTVLSGKAGGSGNGITPSGTKSITANGTYDVTEFASVLVNVASSGGSLPGQVTALRAGSFTMAVDEESYLIDHGLGAKPDFYFVVACGELNLAANAHNLVSISFLLKPYTTAAGAEVEGRGNINYITASNAMSSISSNYPNVTASQIEIPASAAYVLLGGTTYLWVAGTLSGMN